MLNKRIRGLMKALTAAIVSLTVFSNTAVFVGAAEIPSLIPEPQSIETNSIEGWPQAENVISDTACLMDADTGTILYNKGMNLRMYPASTTKVMTALVAIENASLDEVVTVTEAGTAEVYYSSSNLGIMVGEQFTLRDCLYAVLMKSANDFSSQVAEHVGGTVENFVNMMNERALEIGCLDTHFVNAHGMPDANHYTTAYDLALILQEAGKNETFCQITGAQAYTIPTTSLAGERSITSHNALIMPTELYYEGCLGGKTGFTDASMYTFVSFAERDGRRLICSVMHGGDYGQVFADAIQLFDYGFDNFQNVVMDEGQQLYSGGVVTIPATAQETDVVMTEGDHFETNFGVMVAKNYTYHDYPVGASEITETFFEEQNVAETPMLTPTPEVAETEVEEDGALTKDDLKNIDPDVKGFNMEELVTAPHIAIAVLVVLIFVGVILIIVAAVKKSKAKKKKSKKKSYK